MDKTVKERAKQVAAFVKASAEGWKSYLADPAPANALIKKDNPNMTDDQLAYSVAKLKEMGMVTGGDAATERVRPRLIGGTMLSRAAAAVARSIPG